MLLKIMCFQCLILYFSNLLSSKLSKINHFVLTQYHSTLFSIGMKQFLETPCVRMIGCPGDGADPIGYKNYKVRKGRKSYAPNCSAA